MRLAIEPEVAGFIGDGDVDDPDANVGSVVDESVASLVGPIVEPEVAGFVGDGDVDGPDANVGSVVDESVALLVGAIVELIVARFVGDEVGLSVVNGISSTADGSTGSTLL